MRALTWFAELQEERWECIDTPPWPCATVVRVAQQVDLDGQDFMGTVFPVGGRIATTRITSTTTSLDVARRFASGGDDDYVMVFRTAAVLPIALIAGRRENEGLIAPGVGFRVVHTDHSIDGKPTVYLVSEDIVSAAV